MANNHSKTDNNPPTNPPVVEQIAPGLTRTHEAAPVTTEENANEHLVQWISVEVNCKLELDKLIVGVKMEGALPRDFVIDMLAMTTIKKSTGEKMTPEEAANSLNPGEDQKILTQLISNRLQKLKEARLQVKLHRQILQMDEEEIQMQNDFVNNRYFGGGNGGGSFGNGRNGNGGGLAV